MRIFAIRDESIPAHSTIGYLIYYELSKTFYIELDDTIDMWDAPPILSAFVERAEYSIDRYWSRRFVQQRLIPQDRQNINQILRENGIKEYDEFSLLMQTMGRCEQDDFYLEELPAELLPELISQRWKTKIADIVPLNAPKLLVFFRNGVTKIVDLRKLDLPFCAPYLASQARFDTVEVEPDGYGVCWNERAMISHRKLFAYGFSVPLVLQDLHKFVRTRIVNVSEACCILNCSRQNIDDLMRRDKLHPIRSDKKGKLFSIAEVMQRKKFF